MGFGYYCESQKQLVVKDDLLYNRPPFKYKLESVCNSVVRNSEIPLFEKLYCDKPSILMNLPSEITNTDEDFLSLILTALPIFDKAFFINAVAAGLET
jgi:hypothetical protein